MTQPWRVSGRFKHQRKKKEATSNGRKERRRDSKSSGFGGMGSVMFLAPVDAFYTKIQYDPRHFVLGPDWHIWLQHCSVRFQTNRKCSKKQHRDPLLSQTPQIFSIYISEFKKKKSDAVFGLLQLNKMADKTTNSGGKKKPVPTWTTKSSIAGMRLSFHPTQTHTQHWTTHLL